MPPEAERRAAKRAAAIDQAKADKKAAAAEALAAAIAAKAPPERAPVVVPSAAELKAARDARYAARKARKIVASRFARPSRRRPAG